MAITTNLENRVRHTSLPKTAGLMPLFEAVVNSIHSIEEAERVPGKILIRIIRDPQQSMELDQRSPSRGRDALADIVGFEIVDDGVGFNDENLRSFETLDTDHKERLGCRGIGRLLWLKAFDDVRIQSVFQEGGNFRRREFRFSANGGILDLVSEALNETKVDLRTTVRLDGFKAKYKEYARKSGDAIARQLFEHCLWYFIRPGGAPEIKIYDEGESIDLSEIYSEAMHSQSEIEEKDIKGSVFYFTHVKLRTSSAQNHVMGLCAASRLVKEESLRGQIPGLYGRIEDDEGGFVYACYVGSQVLDESVRSERTGFDLDDDVEGLFQDSVVSMADIREAVIDSAKRVLDSHLQISKQRGAARVSDFISNKAPRYRLLNNHVPPDDMVVDPSISDKELDLFLHKKFSEVESIMLRDGHDILRRVDNDESSSYEDDLEKYLKTVTDFRQSDLASYVAHRKVIIDLLEKALTVGEDGKYQKEDVLHKLVMPLRKTSDDCSPDDMNLWLIDERLAFHDFLASDMTLKSMPITGSREAKEPDMLATYFSDIPVLLSEEKHAPFSSITVVEFKRPMRDDASEGEEKDPIEQVLGYLIRAREGKITTKDGRPLGNVNAIPAYCYVVADITPSLKRRCDMHDLIPTPDGLGYFGFKKTYNAYVEVLSFERLLFIAKQRNRAFFDRLGLPSS